MRTAICYRGHYFRDRAKKSNFSLCAENHEEFIYNQLTEYDIYFHSHSVSSEKDAELIDSISPKNYSFQKTDFMSDSFVESNKQILDLGSYDLIINLRFDLFFKKPLNKFDIDSSKFSFLWEESKHYRTQLGYKKVADLMFAMNPSYVDAFNDACVESRFNGGIRGTGHHLHPFIADTIGEHNIGFMIKGHFASNTDGKDNGYVMINREL